MMAPICGSTVTVSGGISWLSSVSVSPQTMLATARKVWVAADTAVVSHVYVKDVFSPPFKVTPVTVPMRL